MHCCHGDRQASLLTVCVVAVGHTMTQQPSWSSARTLASWLRASLGRGYPHEWFGAGCCRSCLWGFLCFQVCVTHWQRAGRVQRSSRATESRPGIGLRTRAVTKEGRKVAGNDVFPKPSMGWAARGRVPRATHFQALSLQTITCSRTAPPTCYCVGTAPTPGRWDTPPSGFFGSFADAPSVDTPILGW